MRSDFNRLCILAWLIGTILLSSPSAAQTPSVVIDEIQTAGISSKDEYIVLYNTTKSPVDISTWSIQYKSATGNTFYKKNFPDESLIPSHGYFFIAHTGYAGEQTPHMTHSTFSLAASGGNVYLVSSQEKLDASTLPQESVDKVAWGTGDDPEEHAASAPEAQQSIIRTDHQDTDNNANDFGLSTSPVIELEPAVETTPEAPPVPTTYTEPAVTPETPTYGTIIINELLPNPYGVDSHSEWIELKNIDTTPIDISGWRISDSSKSHTIQARTLPTTILQPGELVLLSRGITKIALNNSGQERITLEDSNARFVDQVSYSQNTSEGTSFALDEYGKWHWTVAITPGSENVIVPEKKEEPAPAEKEKTPPKKKEPVTTSSLSLDQAIIENSVPEKTVSTEVYTPLIINEFMPNPDGSDEDGEWIELYNTSSSTIPLAGLTLGDNSKKTYVLEDGEVKPKSFAVIDRVDSKIALNNTGDSVKLWAPDGTLLTSTHYGGSAPSGSSYAYDSDHNLWDWTSTPTLGEKNLFPEISDESPEELQTTEEGNDDAEIPETLPLIEAKDLPLGTSITTQGTVAVLPNTFGKTYFYIVDEEVGIKIYSAKKLFPVMTVGDRISVTGSLSESSEELRLKTSQEHDIKLLDHTSLPSPSATTISEIDESLEGSLVTIEGDVVSTKGTTLYLDDGSDEMRIYLATNTGISSRDIRQGESYRITGLVSETKAGYRILPRSIEDIIKTTTPSSGVVAGANTQNILIKSKSHASKKLPLYILLGVVLLTGTFFILNKKFQWIKK